MRGRGSWQAAAAAVAAAEVAEAFAATAAAAPRAAVAAARAAAARVAVRALGADLGPAEVEALAPSGRPLTLRAGGRAGGSATVQDICVSELKSECKHCHWEGNSEQPGPRRHPHP